MINIHKFTTLVLAFGLASACARPRQNAQMEPEAKSTATGTGTATEDESIYDYSAGGGSPDYYMPQDVYPLNGTGVANTAIDPALQGLANSSTLAAGTINPGNNGASGSGINQAAMMQGMMGMMQSMMSGQQPNPATLMGMFAPAGGGILQQMMQGI